jgi:integrase
MATVNFYLKAPEPKSGQSLIFLQSKYSNTRFTYSFGQSINPSNWNKKKQRVKNNHQTTLDGKYMLNELLDNLESEFQKSFNSQLANGIPSKEVLKAALDRYMNEENDKRLETKDEFLTLLDRFINNEIKYKGKDKSPNTIKTYKTFKLHLLEFQQKTKKPLTFDNVDLEFYYSYTTFLKQKGLSVNAIGKDIQILKVVLLEAVDLGLTENLKFKHKKFAVVREETDAVFLTIDELIKFYDFDLSDNKRLEQVRDLFVFGCFVGLRFSDFSSIKPEYHQKDKEGEYLKLITQKTKELVYVPYNKITLMIFNKYENSPNKLPKALSNQKFNSYIKEAAKLAGLTEVGRNANYPQAQLWENITSHTARRSFATNFYRAGVPIIDLMKITGHRTEKSFLRYIKGTKRDTAARIQQRMQAIPFVLQSSNIDPTSKLKIA